MIQILSGIPDELRKPAIALFHEAFKNKFASLMTLDEALSTLPGLLNPEQVIFALQDGKLAGFAGIQHGRKRLFQLPLRPFMKHLGVFRGVYVAIVLMLFGRPYKEGELLMDGICVDKDMRGQGIGSLLLEAVIEFARQKNYRTIRLDVADTNPRARKLYERMGFSPTVTHRYPFTKKYMGFSTSTSMIKTL